jgi:hypothetical protein
MNWFSPAWGAGNSFIHYICQNDRTVAVTNVTNSTGAVINSTAAITNSWTNWIIPFNVTIDMVTDFRDIAAVAALS